MKRVLCLLLCAVLLCGCNTNVQEDTPEQTFLSAFEAVPFDQEPEDPQERLAWRRDVAEKEMRRMMSVLWTPDRDVTYCFSVQSVGLELDKVTQPEYIVTLKAGRIYQGIPYTHGCGSGDAMLSYATAVDENGVHTLSGLTWEHFSGEAKNTQQKCARIGNNCADSVFWAWGKVASSITFKGTTTMTKTFGCIPVGSYKTMPVQYSTHTNGLCQSNGEQTMFEAYAQLQKADGLVFATNGGTGHAIMCVSVHVERLEDGTIDGEKSYAVILEQGSGCEVREENYFNKELGKQVYLCEKLDTKKSFNELYKSGYLPVTCKELIDPAPLAEVKVEDSNKSLSAQNLFTGEISASYRIAFVEAQILDETGKQIQSARCYGKEEEMYRFDLSRFTDKVEQKVMQGSVDPDGLPSGSYRVIFTAHLATGDDVVFRDAKITK